MKSEKYSLNKQDITAIIKVLLWSGVSAIIASLIAVIGQLEVDAQYAFIVPIINSLLFTAQKYLAGR